MKFTPSFTRFSEASRVNRKGRIIVLEREGNISMSRFSLVILPVLILVSFTAPVSLEAQRHGGGSHGGGSMSVRPAPSLTGHGPVTPFLNPPVSAFGRAPVVTSRPFLRQRPIVVAPIYGYGYPYGYGYGSGYGYPYDYSPYSAPTLAEPYYSEPQPVYSQGATDQSNAELSYQVGELSRQIQELRQQQAQTAQPVPAATAAMPVVLIFNDGRRMEIQNYAIIGQVLWILDERNSTKISLSDLDLNATQGENRSRGLRFSLPGQ